MIERTNYHRWLVTCKQFLMILIVLPILFGFQMVTDITNVAPLIRIIRQKMDSAGRVLSGEADVIIKVFYITVGKGESSLIL